jgi:hypothetical protein
MAIWKEQVYGIHALQERQANGTITLEEMRDRIVSRLRKLRPEGEDLELDEILDELAEVDTVHWYDSVKDALYDWADAKRVWIDPTR